LLFVVNRVNPFLETSNIRETNRRDALHTGYVNNWADSFGLTAGASERGEVVSTWIVKVFEAAKIGDKNVMIDHLLGSVGVLSLASVANGVFLWRRLERASTKSWLSAGDSAGIGGNDIRALVHLVQQIDAEAIDSLVELFNTPPLSTNSFVGPALAELPLRRTRRKHAD
jgi:hypothetical protein